MSKDSNAKIFSVVGSCRRSGRWLVPAKTKMMTLFGRAVIDLRLAQTGAEEIEFTCLSVFANITFLVPEGAEVRPSGMAIFGSSRSMVPLSGVPCDLPPMSIDATTVFGRLRVRTTDLDPDEEQGKRRFRRRRTAEPSTMPTAADTAVSAPTGVDTRDLAEAVSASPSPVAAQPTRPEPSANPPRDLSAPIEPFISDDDASPIHNVSAPDSIEGTAAEEPETPEFLTDDPQPTSAAPTEFLTDDPEPADA